MPDDSGPVLGPDEARALLRECVTVVAPGETLVIRVDKAWSEADADNFYQRVAALGLPFRVLLMPGEEFAVALDRGDVWELTWPERREIARQIGQI